MTDLWFYGQEGNKQGPFTARQLQELAAAGRIVATDTIWKQGIERGALAKNTKNLFPSAPASQPAANDIPPTGAAPAPSNETPMIANDALQGAPANNATLAGPSAPPRHQPKKGRALAVRGAIIVNQDGSTVQFKKKCTQCGHEESSRSTMPIRHGMIRVSFFCPKCRKARQVEIQGIF